MDFRGIVLAVMVVFSCLCVSYITAAAEEESQRFNEVAAQHEGPTIRLAMIEKMLREDVERELVDLKRLETALFGQMNMLSEKKRQLEIKRRGGVQCLVNVVACWKRK